MNQENTKRTEEAKNKLNENIMNIHHVDMSQEAPMMPVYMPIIEEHHGVMFVNSLKGLMIHVLLMYFPIWIVMKS